MCGNCGCATTETVKHEHNHPHDHSHNHRLIDIKQSVLHKNNTLAQANRQEFTDKNILVLNILSSPGSGKTTLIEKTIKATQQQFNYAVIVGDLATDNDAQRLKSTNAPVMQITTGDICHLEASMIKTACDNLGLESCDILIIENVGNLVCPAAYDLGEDLRIVLLSTTEGEDKPLKYPTMFKGADVVIITKIDLAEAVEWHEEIARDNIGKIAPQALILEVSARKDLDMTSWYNYLHQAKQEKTSKLPLPYRVDSK